MALKVRLARGGAKKKPFYRIVVAEASAPRDGRFIERVGSYNPMVDSEERIVLKTERCQYWISQGAKPTERVSKLLSNKGLLDAPKIAERPKKSRPKKKAQERLEALAQAKTDAERAAQENGEAATPDASEDVSS